MPKRKPEKESKHTRPHRARSPLGAPNAAELLVWGSCLVASQGDVKLDIVVPGCSMGVPTEDFRCERKRRGRSAFMVSWVGHLGARFFSERTN